MARHRRVIFHIDVNSAFLSWTAVQLMQSGHQDIRLVPSVVSGDPSDRRSIITAASIPAKKIGIKTAEPVTMALRKCPDLVVVKGDWEWYRRCSEGFIEICRKYSPVLQQFSIDECFIDMSLRNWGEDPVDVATRLKEEVKTTLGFTVNVGIGSNKLLAKMASEFEKPDKVHTLWEEEVQEKMWPLDVRELLWVGKKTEEKLKMYGIRTIGDLASRSVGSLTRLVGKKFASQLHENANGRDDSPVETEVPEAKSISAERTFSNDIGTEKDVDRALFNVACIVAHRMRRADFYTSCVSVFIKYKDFSVVQRQHQMSQPTNITAVILNEARALIRDIWDGESPIRQIGLGVSKLTHENAVQMSLFEDPKMDYYREWDRKYDEEKSQNEDAKTLVYERMKQLSLILIFMTFSLLGFSKEYKVYGPQGGLAMEVTIPDDIKNNTDKCPMVILMHGIFSSKNIVPIPTLAKALAKEGIASICFDFGGHWKSEGKMQHMTVGKEIEDAMAMWEYAKSLPYVSKIGLLGHSQGGVVASMTAGILASRGESPAALVLVAPGSVIQDACKGGRFFGAEFNPADPPEYVKCFGIMKLGRDYILSTQELDIYGTAKTYTGPVRLIHGSKDNIVPMSCSEKFVETYTQNAELIVVEGENHMITRKLKTVVSHAVSFFVSRLK